MVEKQQFFIPTERRHLQKQRRSGSRLVENLLGPFSPFSLMEGKAQISNQSNDPSLNRFQNRDEEE